MTPIEIERLGPMRRPRARRLDRRLASLPPAGDRRARSGVAGGAGGAEDVRLHHRRERRPGRRPGPNSRAPSSAPAPRRCGSTTCAAATRPCRSPTSRSRSPGRRSSSRSRCSTPPGAAATRPASSRPSCSSSPSSRAAPPTRSACAAAIESRSLDGQPLAHWDLLRERLAAHPERTFQHRLALARAA